MTPLEIMLSNNRDERHQEMLAQGLRGRQDVSTLAMLSGDQTVGNFGKALGGSVEQRVSQRLAEREKQKQRDLTQGYYDQMAEQFGLSDAHRKNVLAETIRHHKAMEAKAGLTLGKYQDSQIRNLSRDLTKANIPEVAASIDAVNQELKKYEGKNIPGIGQVQSALPGVMLPESGREFRSTLARIRNILLKARSGGAVTPEEADRLYEEFSLSLGFSDDNFRKSWTEFQEIFGQSVNNVFAGYDPETITLYQQRMSLGEGTPAEQAQQGAEETRQPVSSQGFTYEVIPD